MYHQQATMSNKNRVMKKLFRMELVRGGSLKDYLREISERFDQLADIGSRLGDGVTVKVTLASLNNEYGGMEAARLALVTVKAKLIEEYAKKKENDIISRYWHVCYIEGIISLFTNARPNVKILDKECPQLPIS